MSTPGDTTSVDGPGATDLLSRPRPYAVAALAAAVCGVAVALAPDGVAPVTGTTAGALLAGVLAAVAVLAAQLAVASYRITDRVRFHGNGLAVEKGVGPLGRTTEVAYDDVDLVVRRDSGDATTWEVIRSGSPSVETGPLRDPETVESALCERVPSPAERNRELLEDAEKSMEERLAERGVMVPGADDADEAPPRPVADERVFWRGWPRSEPLPESPVVEGSALPGSLGPMNQRTPERRERSRTIGSGEHTVEEIAAGEVARTNADETPWTWAAREDNRLRRTDDDRR
jgi:hypothetical protein